MHEVTKMVSDLRRRYGDEVVYLVHLINSVSGACKTSPHGEVVYKTFARCIASRLRELKVEPSVLDECEAEINRINLSRVHYAALDVPIADEDVWFDLDLIRQGRA